MYKIEFTADVKFGDVVIDSIEVAPLSFVELTRIWSTAGITEATLPRYRILHQVHFTASGKRVIPDIPQLHQLPFGLAKDLIDALDYDQGEMGKVVAEGDCVSKPVLVQLGTPIKMKDGKGEEVVISELEFLAKTYGEVEDVLASDNNLTKAVKLLATVAHPTSGPLTRLPGWALDRITMADGVLIMRSVVPHF